MGLFNKVIPKSKWTDVLGELHRELKQYRTKWFAEFNANLEGVKQLVHLSPEADSAIASLQFAVSATRVREGGYVTLNEYADFMALLYITITGRDAAQMQDDFAMRLLKISDAQSAMKEWGSVMAAKLTRGTPSGEPISLLARWSAAIITHAMISTSEACYDSKGADVLRSGLK